MQCWVCTAASFQCAVSQTSECDPVTRPPKSKQYWRETRRKSLKNGKMNLSWLKEMYKFNLFNIIKRQAWYLDTTCPQELWPKHFANALDQFRPGQTAIQKETNDTGRTFLKYSIEVVATLIEELAHILLISRVFSPAWLFQTVDNAFFITNLNAS